MIIDRPFDHLRAFLAEQFDFLGLSSRRPSVLGDQHAYPLSETLDMFTLLHQDGEGAVDCPPVRRLCSSEADY